MTEFGVGDFHGTCELWYLEIYNYIVICNLG